MSGMYKLLLQALTSTMGELDEQLYHTEIYNCNHLAMT